MMSFFGASKDASGNYYFNNEERLPENWYNRKASYSRDVGREIFEMYFVDVSQIFTQYEAFTNDGTAQAIWRQCRKGQFPRPEL